MRQALAESRNAVAVWITRQIGVHRVIRAARELGVTSPLEPYLTTALGASRSACSSWRASIARWLRGSWPSHTSSIA